MKTLSKKSLEILQKYYYDKKITIPLYQFIKRNDYLARIKNLRYKEYKELKESQGLPFLSSEEFKKKKTGRNIKKEGRKCVKFIPKIKKVFLTDGFGRSYYWYQCNITIDGKTKTKKFSVSKYGDFEAKMAASLQRVIWMIEFKVFEPKNGDIFQNLFYEDSFKNKEYKNCKIVDVSSPYLKEYEKE